MQCRLQDLAHTASTLFPVRVVLYTLKGLYYPKKVMTECPANCFVT